MEALQVLSPAEVCKLTTVKKASLWGFVRAGHFPQPLRLGPKKRGWFAKDVAQWLEGRRAT